MMVSDKIWRAQTIVSRAGEYKTLAFYIIYIEGKPFSDALKKIKSGDEVYLDAVPYGHFTLDRFDSWRRPLALFHRYRGRSLLVHASTGKNLEELFHDNSYM